MSDPNKYTRWRIESLQGHVVFLFAENLVHAGERWREFYPNVAAYVFRKL